MRRAWVGSQGWGPLHEKGRKEINEAGCTVSRSWGQYWTGPDRFVATRPVAPRINDERTSVGRRGLLHHNHSQPLGSGASCGARAEREGGQTRCQRFEFHRVSPEGLHKHDSASSTHRKPQLRPKGRSPGPQMPEIICTAKTGCELGAFKHSAVTLQTPAVSPGPMALAAAQMPEELQLTRSD